MPRCLVNLAHLDPPNNGGVSRLAREVSIALLSQAPSTLRTILVVRARFLPHFRQWLGIRFNAVVIPYFRQLSPGLILRLVKPDIVVSPLFGVEPFVSTGNLPHMTNIPDTLVLDHPTLFSSLELQSRQQVYQRASLAQVVVTLSEYARSRIQQHFPTLSASIQVIAPGSDSLSQRSAEFPVRPPYVFYPANTWPHKRHKLLLQSMSLIWQVMPEMKLVLSGGRPPNIDLKALIAQYAPPGQAIDLGYVTERQLSGLYSQAEVLLFTSEYEGFGMPVLEAMYAGCPVICAPLSAMPEVAGDAALYVDSERADDWAEAFLTRLPKVREELVRCGRQRASQFTWAQTRQKWVELVLRTIAASSSGG